ncbi:MAG: MFS transporter [Pseudomonadota bacterium]|uniref:MFS transporter n=1 Tax=Alteromonas alba TaxID=2079529 RepID=A0A2S9VB84_9ALTE|nr:MFS transporter [Alteromonas alba]MCP4863543.1 MFS transporter [Alteromonas sp.]MDY6927384.1 MFS transporter [Pseudomonadota bacterium]PRO73696.1 MFS transporter [Alteromonas alba]
MNTQQNTLTTETPEAYWSGVFAMTICVFTLIASEFMPVSLLTPIADTLQITNGMAGQGIAISGAFAVVTSLFISSLTANVNRKALLLLLTVIMGISGAIIGLAANYTMYMIGRALIGVVIGGFWSMSAAIAMRLVPQDKVSKALAVFNSGNALAVVIAAPLGAYLGELIGWRGAFLSLIPIAVITFIWQSLSLPSMPPVAKEQEAAGIFAVFTQLKRKVVVVGMLAVGLFFLGQFSLYTYIRPFLETVTGVEVTTLSLLLMFIGIMGFVGTMVINIPLKHAFYPTLILMPVILALIALSLTLFGNLFAAVVMLLGVWGLVATAAPVGWWAWVPKTFPNDAEAGGGLMVAIIQLSIALGSTLGGVLYDLEGYMTTFAASALILLVASTLAVWTARLSR